LLNKFQKVKQEIELQLKTLENYEKQYPLDLKKNLTNIYEEIQKLPKFANDIRISKKEISFYLDKKIQTPELLLEDLKEFFSKLNSKLNLDKNQIRFLFDKNIILWIDYSDLLLIEFSKFFEFKESEAWKNIKQVNESAGYL